MPAYLPAATLTVYRDGQTNLNGDATRLLADAAGIMLLPPTTPGTRWQLLPRSTATGAYMLSGRPDRGNVRFRSPLLAAALFAALPPEFAGPLYLELRRLGTESGYELVALSKPENSLPKAGQQNIDATAVTA